jgi:hypothetical protein
MWNCHACRKEVPRDLKVGRKDACPSCNADLRCCLNCTFHDRTAPKQCKEPVAELVREKTKSNFCDYFIFAASRTTATADAQVEEARKTLDSMFRK